MKSNLSLKSVSFLTCFWYLILAGPASAAFITYSYTGLVDSVDDPYDMIGVQLGDKFQFTFTFDNTLTDDSNPLPDVADYEALVNSSTTFYRSSDDSLIFTFSFSIPWTLEILNDRSIGGAPIDGFVVSTADTEIISSIEIIETAMHLEMLTEELSRFSSTDLSMLTPSTLDPGLFEQRHFINFNQYRPLLPSPMYVGIRGEVTGVGTVPVPEPSTGLLLGPCLMILSGIRRKIAQ